MRYELRIEGLDCANCALKIERAVSALNGVERAGLSFATGALHIEASREDAAFATEINRTVHALEGGAVVIPRNPAAEALWSLQEEALLCPVQGDCECPCGHQHGEHRRCPSDNHSHTEQGHARKKGHTHENEHAHSGEHTHSHAGGGRLSIGLFAAAAILFAAGLFDLPGWGKPVCFALSVVLAGWPIFLQALRGLRHISLDENLLVTIAVIAAFAIGEWPEAALVTLLFRLGNYLEDLALSRSRRSIEALAEICPDTARLVTSDGAQEIDARSLRPGDTIEIAPFERIAADGVIESGQTHLDASALTGEAMPVMAGPGDEVLSGMLNQQGLIRVRVSRTSEDSSAARILRLVEDAAGQKGEGERFITRFARIYTPAILVAALLLCLIPTLFVGSFTVWLSRALVFLVASCPCALVISIPLAYFSAIGAASKMGVLIKGGRFVELLSKCRTIAFDKTGTLTTGKLEITEIRCNGVEQERLLRLAGQLEAHSAHPIARVIVERAGSPEALSGQYSEIPGRGVRYQDGNITALAGSARLMAEEGVDCSALGDASVYIALSGKAVGALSIGDRAREDAAETIERLRALGVEQIAMLTGDSSAAAERTAQECGLNQVYSSLLPEDKVARMSELRAGGAPAVFVGDGINDAPVLACADVGIAMGFGTDSAIESADGVLSGSRLSRLPDVIVLFRRAMGMIRFNTVFALAVKAVVLALGALGLAPMWLAVFADVGVSMLTVLNSSRLLLHSKKD